VALATCEGAYWPPTTSVTTTRSRRDIVDSYLDPASPRSPRRPIVGGPFEGLRTVVQIAIALLWLLSVLLPSAAYAEKRVALLIGNQSYESEIGRLANPHNDVALLEKSLKGLGFDVAVERDASRTRLHYCG